jgi:hypothetical protein
MRGFGVDDVFGDEQGFEDGTWPADEDAHDGWDEPPPAPAPKAAPKPGAKQPAPKSSSAVHP